jgi:hypothetical protein
MTKNSYKQQDRVTTAPFRFIQFLTTGTAAGYTTGALELNPANLGPRALAMSGIYNFWRFRALRISARSSTVATPSEIAGAVATPSGCVFAVAYSPLPAGDQTTSTSFVDLAQLNCFDMKPTTEVAQVTVPAKTFRSIPYMWLRCKGTNTPPLDELSGGSAQYLIRNEVALAAGITVWFEIEGVIDYRGQISSATSVARDIPLSSSEFIPLSDEKESSVLDEDWGSVTSNVDTTPSLSRQASLRGPPSMILNRSVLGPKLLPATTFLARGTRLSASSV